MVTLVVHDENVLHAHQVGHDPLQHLSLGLQCVQRLPTPAFQQPASPFRHLHAFPQYEGMVVGYDDLGPVEVAQHVAGHQLSADVVAVRIVGLQYAQPVPDRNPWRHNQKTACEPPAVGMSDGVDRLPRD